jgi:murein DD-endopeptidase MepM/ murein hydrolase activator NlpD
MDDSAKENSSWFKRLTNKYRLVILNDESFEEVSSFRLSRFNVYIFLSTIFILLVFLITSVLVFTPLKEYIPGYTGSDFRNEIVALQLKADSLEQESKAADLYLNNMLQIVNGNVPVVKIDTPLIDVGTTKKNYDTINLKSVSGKERKLRGQMENESSYSLGLNLSLNTSPGQTNLKSYYFFPPIKGYVTDEFDPKKDHYGVDVVAPENEAIKACMDGVVLFSTWTSETGYVIALQHRNNLISLYKHNSVLLKKEGSYVRAGDVIAIIGNTGEHSTGPHLHFEIWYNGIPLNPKDYIVFK